VRADDQGKLISVRTEDLSPNSLPVPFNVSNIVPLEDTHLILESIKRLVPKPKILVGQKKHEVVSPKLEASEESLYDVFIAYSRKDREICERLVERLGANELDTFYDQYLRAGERWRSIIAKNIKRSTVFVVLISKDSIESEEVENETNLAISSGPKIIPIRIDGSPLNDSFELMLLNYNIVDAAHGRIGEVFSEVALEVKKIVALRAFDKRRLRGSADNNVPRANKFRGMKNFVLVALLIIWAMCSSLALASVATGVGYDGHLSLVALTAILFILIGLPYALFSGLLLKSLLR
jgi:hypothetical protein